jgi:hypothetical protein
LARLLEREFVGLAALVAVWLVHLSLSFARQRLDTRVFMGLYAQIATYIVGEQQGRGHGTSTISARVEMVRDVVGILRERGSGDLPEHPDDRRLTRDAFVYDIDAGTLASGAQRAWYPHGLFVPQPGLQRAALVSASN